MTHELNNDEQKAVEAILDALNGFTFQQAEQILKEVKNELKERAVING